MMKNFFRVIFISLCLVVSQAPTISLAQSDGETEIHGSSVDLVFSSRSIDRYIGHLTLFAAGLVSMYQVRRCTSPAITCGVSTWVSALAGVSLLAGEIANIATHKNILRNLEYNKAELDENREECLTGSAGEERVNANTDKKVCSQFGAIIAQRNAYESIARGLRVQQTLRFAAGMAYGVASGMEVTAHIRRTFSDSAIISSASAAQMSCPLAAAGPQASVCAESVARCEAALGVFQGFMNDKMRQFNDPSPSPSLATCTLLRGEHLAAKTAVQLGCGVGCCAGNVASLLAQLGVETQTLNCLANFSACDLGCQPPINGPLTESSSPQKPSKKWVKNLLENILPRAQAQANREVSVNSIFQQIGSALSLSTFGATTLTGLISTKKYVGDNLFSTPVKRAVWYGALGAIVGLSSLHTREALEEVNGYITDLNNLISAGDLELDSHNPTPSTTLAGDQAVTANFEDYADIQYPEYQAMAKALCPNGGDGKSKCLEVPEQIYADLRELNLNDVAGVVSNLEDMGNEILRPKGSIKNALKMANKLAGKKALVKNFSDEARKMLKEGQEENGIEPIDMDAEIKRAAMYGMQNTKNYLKEKKVDLNKMFKHDIQEEENDSEDKKVEASPLAKKSPIKIDSDLASELSQPTIRFNLGSSDSKESESEVREEKDQDFSNVKAVHKREEGLFEAITRRYKESGFAKLLEEL